MPATRDQLITRAKERGDFENDENITPAFWNSAADGEVKVLWRLLVRQFPDHFAAGPTQFTLSGTTDTKALSDFTPLPWKIRAIDYQNSATWEKVQRFSLENRNRVRRAYRLLGRSIRFTPAADAAGTYRIWYIPQPTAFSGGSAEVDAALDMYDELIVLGMALRALKRQKKDTLELERERTELLRDVMASAEDNDVGEPDRVIDVDGGNWADELPGAG